VFAGTVDVPVLGEGITQELLLCPGARVGVGEERHVTMYDGEFPAVLLKHPVRTRDEISTEDTLSCRSKFG